MKFIQARNYSRASGRSIDVIVIHTMEAPEKPNTAEAIARWFAGRDAPQASAHYCIDANSVVRCVDERDVAWAAPGANHNGIQLEHAGRARQDSKGWHDLYSQRMLERSAKLAAGIARRHNIPIRFLNEGDLKAGRRGFTGHVQVTRAFRRSTHTDPGPFFPWGEYLRLVKDTPRRGLRYRLRYRHGIPYTEEL